MQGSRIAPSFRTRIETHEGEPSLQVQLHIFPLAAYCPPSASPCFGIMGLAVRCCWVCCSSRFANGPFGRNQDTPQQFRRKCVSSAPAPPAPKMQGMLNGVLHCCVIQRVYRVKERLMETRKTEQRRKHGVQAGSTDDAREHILSPWGTRVVILQASSRSRQNPKPRLRNALKSCEGRISSLRCLTVD